MERYFLQVGDDGFGINDVCTIGLRYDDRNQQFMIGSLGRHKEFVERIAMEYFGLDVFDKEGGVVESWPQANKMRFTSAMERKQFVRGLYKLRETYPCGVLKTRSLGRLVR